MFFGIELRQVDFVIAQFSFKRLNEGVFEEIQHGRDDFRSRLIEAARERDRKMAFMFVK